jgi:hypothetical protein
VADGEDLADVVASVCEVEAAPLRGSEWAQSKVTLAGKSTKGLVCLIEDEIELAKGSGG